MSRQTVSGIEKGQRQLNGPQTSGREYKNLSQPQYTRICDQDVQIPVRDGKFLLADIHRPKEAGHYPVLIAASPYLRQIQDLGAPAGFIEAGASDFLVPRGYVHIILNLRGTGGSEGVFTFSDGQERRDLYDAIEWAAEQSWSDGNIGMIGISYFAGTQMEAAVEQPPHLKAIMPVAGSFDMYNSSYHHGLLSASFITPFLYMIGMTSGLSNKFLRGNFIAAARTILTTPAIHKKFAHANGEAAIAGLKLLLKLHHAPHPWDDLWLSIAAEHPFRDEWWDDRDLFPLLEKIKIPVYLGCDWQNVPLHLRHTFPAFKALKNSEHVRVAMMDDYGLTWPWESLHIEALAWFDHWLKGKDTGILDGPRFRYVLPGTGKWYASDSWPITGTTYQSYALNADGLLDEKESAKGERKMLILGQGMNRPKPSEIDPPSQLIWETKVFEKDMDMVGEIELQLDAISSASDTAWITVLQEVEKDGNIIDITSGFLRAGLREIDEVQSRLGAPVLPCRNFKAIPVGEKVTYRIPLVPNARRFKAGSKIRLYISNDDQSKDMPALLEFRHATIGISCMSKILSSSRLLLPVIPSQD
jgi:uncharacterized protein